MIDRERLKQTLLELVQIDSLSRREREVAQRLVREMRALGAEVWVDDAGEKVGGNTGNVIARVAGTVPEAPPLLLSAHMDTVAPGEGVKPIVEGDIIRTDGTTVLGGDDKSGVAIICEVVRALREHRLPHGDLEIVFTVCEEVGLLGAQHLDVSRLRARHGLVLDSDAAGFLFTRAPASDRLEFEVLGLEAHAGVCPERGISAIKIAAEAIAAMQLGRIDAETTANLGVIEGGTATNVVPKRVVVRGEARSHDEAKLAAQVAHMRQCFQEAAARHRVEIDGRLYTGQVVEKIARSYDRMHVPDESRIVQLVFQAAQQLGHEVQTLATGGGCDANVFNRQGIQVANLGTGMRDIHTVREWLDVNDMVRAAHIVLEVVKLNAQAA
jgi:tripeptide aminopeptidase